MREEPTHDTERDFSLDIEDFSGRNFDTDVIDTIVESSHSEAPVESKNTDDILDEDHWASDSFDDFHVDKEF